MKFLVTPNMPQAHVMLAAVDGRIPAAMEQKLRSMGIELIKTPLYAGVGGPIAGHPDLVLHPIGEDRMVIAPDTDPQLQSTLTSYGFTLIKGATSLSAKYPGDIAYNVARVGGFYLHNLRYTDPVLRAELEKAGAEPIHVEQGYAKCAAAIVGCNRIITSDAGMAKAADRKGIEVLLIPPDEEIRLPGLNYGFIGGSSGLVGPSAWAVFGSSERLSASAQIGHFLRNIGMETVSLSEGPVIDLGSLLPLAEQG